MTSLLATSEDLRRKAIDVAEQWQARAEALQARVKELDGRYLGAVAARGMLRDRADEAESRAARDGGDNITTKPEKETK